MSDLSSRNPALLSASERYPDLVKALISFITEPAVVRLLEAGGQTEGSLVFNIKKCQIVSFIPQLEMKLGYEISH
jgi:hypothetical protein